MTSIRSYAKALVTAAALTLLTTGSTAHAQDKPNTTSGHGDFIVTCLSIPDVGRGDGLALILQTPEGHTYLYDTGSGYPTTANASGWVGNFNAGRDLIDPFLRKHHIKKIDGIAISHAHWDHYGGLIWLLDHYKIGKVYDSGYDFPGPLPPAWQAELGGYAKLRDRFKKFGIYQKVEAGDKLPWDRQLDVEVIAPPKGFFPGLKQNLYPAYDIPAHHLVNANSLEMRIRHGNLVFLLPGDIQGEDQVASLLRLVPAEKFKADILIAPGHGISAHQMPEFAAAVQPKVVLASAFKSVAESSNAPAIYGKYGAKVYITGLDGTITVLSDGYHFNVHTEGNNETNYF